MAEKVKLTQAQKGVLLECIGIPESMGYNLPAVSKMRPDTDPVRLRDAIVSMCAAHQNFRIRISFEGSEPVQYLSRESRVEVPIYDKSEAEAQKFIEEFVRPFSIIESPLVRMAVVRTPEAVYWLSDLHHLITDGTTQFLAASEVGARYDGQEPEKEQTTFLEYARREPLSGGEESREYYRRLYEGVEPLRLKAPKGSPLGKTISFSEFADASLTEAFCRAQGYTPSFLFHAAYCVALGTWLHNRTVCFSTLSHGRYERSLRSTFGMLIKTYPVIRRMDPDLPVRDFVMGFRGEMMGQLRHSDYSFLEFCSDRGFVPETMFAFQGPAILEKFSIGGGYAYVSQPHSGSDSTFDLSTVVYLRDGSYEIRVECSDAIHDAPFIELFAHTVKGALESIMANPDGRLSDISTSGGAILRSASQPDEPDVVGLIDSFALSSPDSMAVCCPPASLTYRELKFLSDAFADRLRSAGFLPGSCACIVQGRSINYIVSMLGVLKAGGCYVPLEPGLPEERLRTIVSDSGAGFLITDEGIESTGTGREGASDIAYIIYTSGSTGHPKGVEISVRALSAFVSSISRVLGISASDRISCHSSFAFDASVEDIYPVLCAGGTLFVVPEDIRRDPSSLVRFLSDHRITGGNYTTRFGTILLEQYDLPGLRYLVLGGEKMTVYPRRNRALRLINTYGPTEFTVDATWFELDPSQDEYEDIPIGRPLPGVDAFVLDCNLHPVPDGVPGELCLCGNQMATGYRSLPELTFEAFGAGMYRTGDIVVRRGGLLYYIGRRDSQIKLRGFRIETGEIEAHAVACPQVQQAVLKVSSDGTQLNCYYTGSAAEESLREYIAARVPAYMVPDAYLRMSQIPLTQNGKTDYSKLPPLSRRACGSVVLPEGPFEEALYAAACKVLGHSMFGVTDDLFSLGLSSLGAISLELEAEKSGFKVKTRDILSLKTVRAVAHASACSPLAAFGEHTGKPVAVLVSGVTWPEELVPLCNRLSASYDLYVIEPVSDHQGLASSVGGFADVYASLVLDIGRPVSLLVGHSFGGEMALLLGLRLASAPELYMLDTSAKIKVPREVTSMIGASSMPEDLKSYWKVYIERSRPAVDLHEDKSIRAYPGACTLFYSARRASNARQMAARMPGLRLVPVPAGHMEMLQASFVDRIL